MVCVANQVDVIGDFVVSRRGIRIQEKVMFDSHEMSDVEFDKLCNKTIEVVFPNGETDFAKCLWRLTEGDYLHSFNIARNITLRHGFDIDDHVFDAAVGDINGGIEVEWNTYDTHQDQRQYLQLVKENNVMGSKIGGNSGSAII